MLVRARRLRRVVSRSRAGLAETLAMLTLYASYSRLQGGLGTDRDAALANAGAIQRVEAMMGVDVEPAANAWLAERAGLSGAAALVYGACLVAPPVVLWLLWRRGDRYRPLRNALLATTALAVPVFWRFPVAPPRFAQPGAVDIVAVAGVLGDATAADSGSGHDLYAAMPSLHVAWSLWCAGALIVAFGAGRPGVRAACWAIPAITVADVIGTANHYVLDVLAGGAIFAVGWGLAQLWSTAPRQPWPRWRPRPAGSGPPG